MSEQQFQKVRGDWHVEMFAFFPYFFGSVKIDVSRVVATFQLLRHFVHFPLNHDYWRKSRTSRHQGEQKKLEMITFTFPSDQHFHTWKDAWKT